MPDINSTNGVSEEQEKKDSKKQDGSLETKFIRDFAGFKLHGKDNRDNKGVFIKDVMATETISPDLKAEMEAYGGEKSSFDGVDYDKIKMSWLQREVRGSFVEIKGRKDSIKESLLREYDIDSSKYDGKVGRFIDEMEEKELIDLQNSQNSRKNLLSKLYKKEELPEKKDFLKTLEKLNFSERVKEKLKKLTGEKHDDLIDLSNRFSTLQKIDTFDIQILFEIDFFTLEEKRDIVHTFLPIISLYDAKKLGIMTESQIEKYKYKFVKYNFFDDENISSGEITNITNKLDNSNLLVSTSDYVVDESHIESITKDGKFTYKIGQNISGDITKSVEEIQKEKEQREVDKGGRSVEGFKEKLKSLRTINSENFKAGNVIVVKIGEELKGEGGSTTSMKSTYFWDIKKDGNGTGKTILVNKGEEIYGSSNEVFERTYASLAKFIEKGNPEKKMTVDSFEIITKQELRDRIDSGGIKEEVDELELRDDNYSKLEKEELENKLEEIRKRLRTEKGLSADKIKENSEYLKIQEKLNEIEDYNLDYLKRKITENVDSAGKDFGLDDGVTFKTKKGAIYTILTINKEKKEITITSRAGEETPISFEMFYKIFKKEGCERTSASKTIDDVVSSAQDNGDIKLIWEKFELKGNSIQKKGTDSNIDYPYLVSKEGEEVFKIERVYGDVVKVTTGKYDEKTIEDKDGKEKEKQKIYTMDTVSFDITLGELDTHIKKFKLVPRGVDEDKDIAKDDIKTKELKGSFFSRLFDKHFSVSELIAGGKVWIDSFENYLKEGNEEHAAKFASGVLGKLLPEEIKNDLKTRVEQAGKKRMDDYVEKLKSVDSGIATKMIEGRLLNKDVPSYKLEAGMIFMMEKYGTLYAKGPLYKYKGSFIWYKAMGGKVNDEKYNEQKKEHEDYGVNFTEEHLVFMLVKAQCKPSGYKGVKRRTRLHKEFKALRNKAKEEERDKGKKDASGRRTIESRTDYAIGELKGGTYANAMGALESIVGKGGDMTLMNKLPIVMSFSGVAYNMDEDTLDKFKNNIAAGRLIPTSSLMSKREHMKIFNDTILELSKDLAEIHGGKYADMGKKAQDIFNHIDDNKHGGSDKAENGERNEEVKLKKTLSFYDNYGDVLSRSLNMLNTGKKDNLSKTDKILITRMSSYYDEKSKSYKNGNPKYKKYYGLFNTMMSELGKYTDEDYMMQSLAGTGTSGMNIYQASKETLLQVQGGGFRHNNIGPMIWEEIYTELDNIIESKGTYIEGKGNEKADEEERAKILKHMLRGLIAGLVESHGTRDTALFSLNKPTSPFASRFNKRGIDMRDIANYSLSTEKILDESNIEMNNLLNKYVKNMLTGKNASIANVDEIIPTTEGLVDNILEET